jgi:hypothetical protein
MLWLRYSSSAASPQMNGVGRARMLKKGELIAEFLLTPDLLNLRRYAHTVPGTP